MLAVPRDYPDYLRHSDHDTPVPTWAQVTRSVAAANPDMIARVARIIAGTDDERAAREVWAAWPGNYQRSMALLMDKLDDEGWLDSIGQIDGWPWDGGFFCWPRTTARGTFSDVLNSMSGAGGTMIANHIGNGLFAYLNAYHHKAWKQGWMETDTATAALHVGLMADGRVEIHLDVFNPLFINGAPARDLVRIPRLGVFNRKQFMLHRRWEQSRFAALARTSANFYHLMRASLPLSF
jgi:hypothetical protein